MIQISPDISQLLYNKLLNFCSHISNNFYSTTINIGLHFSSVGKGFGAKKKGWNSVIKFRRLWCNSENDPTNLVQHSKWWIQCVSQVSELHGRLNHFMKSLHGLSNFSAWTLGAGLWGTCVLVISLHTESSLFNRPWSSETCHSIDTVSTI